MITDINIKRKKDNQYNYNYKLTKKYSNFISSILNTLTGKKINNNSISFTSHSVQSLKELLREKNNKLSYRHQLLLFLHLGEQIKSLINDNMSLIEINIEDITVIHMDKEKYKSKFILSNANNIVPLVKNQVELYKPYNKKNLFISPDLYYNDKLPYYTSPKFIYYSLGLFVVYCNIPYKNTVDMYNDGVLKKHIENIEDTKLYWAILRCLEKNVNDRYYLYI